MEQRVALVSPEHVPDELGGSYQDACRALGLEPASTGYAVYLLDSPNSRATVISTDVTPVREALNDLGVAGSEVVLTTLATVDTVLASGCVVAIRPAWPEEFGGGQRCQFCRAPDPAWVYEGAAVHVLLGKPWPGVLPAVVGSEVVGCADWPACGICRDLIEAADFSSWRRLLDRYGDPDVPMEVQSAWREFWDNHRRPVPAPQPEWTPARRRLETNRIRMAWDDFIDRYPLDEIIFTDQPDIPELAGLDAVLAAAGAYRHEPPPRGRIRRYPTDDQAFVIVRADGDDWSLVGHTGRPHPVGFVLRDDAPHTVAAFTGASARILDDLAALALRGNQPQ